MSAPPDSAAAQRETTVLFADVSGSTRLYETAGDSAAHSAIERCIRELARVTGANGGRVVKTIGDEVMALFPRADAAAMAAAAMHAAIDQLAPVANTKLAIRVGFHAGPVIQREADVFGDTVNLAARLAEVASKGQIITSGETAALLGPLFRSFTRALYAIAVKGKSEEVQLCELVWKQDTEATSVTLSQPKPKAPFAPLRLRYGGKETTRRRENDSITLGREQGCGLLVAGDKASRQHCTIERRGDKWVLKDHSSNGTYVTVEGDSEILLRREEMTLRRHGSIAFGEPRAGAREVVEYYCD